MQSPSKRQIRAGRSVPTPSAPPGASPRRPLAPRLTTVDLIERIVGLQLRRVPLDTLASEALPAALQTFGATAGALLLYRCEDESLVLVAEQGLSDAGRQRLTALRKGAAEAWEIPLHGLLNRKAYIIERPDQHPFVPELVPQGNGPQVVNLATVPLYRGALPVGVLLLIADRRPITEAEILSAVLALDVLALALEPFLRARATAASAPAATTASAAEPGALVCEPWVEPRAAADRLEAELEALTHEREMLGARLTETETRLAAAERAAGDIGQRLRDEIAAQAREIERLQATHALARATAHAGDAHTLAAELATAQAEAARLREDRAQVLAAIGDAGADPAAAIRALREQIAHADRQSAACATEREELARVTAQRERRAIECLDAERRAQAVERESLQERLAGVERSRAEQAAQLAALEHELAVRGESIAAAAGQNEILERELFTLRAELARLRENRARVLAVVDGPGAEPAAVIKALSENVAALEAERTEQARRADTAAEEAEHRLAVERRKVAEARASHRAEVEQLEAAHQRALEEMAARVARIEEEQRAACARLETDRDAARAQVDALRVELAARDASLAAHESTLVHLSGTSARAEADAQHQRMLADARVAHQRALAVATVRTATVTEVPVADAPAAKLAAEVAPPPAMEVRQVAGHRILEPDAARRAAIFDVLAAALPPAPGKTFMVANLLTALPEGAADLAAAASAGVTVVGYAADAHGQSRIVGALRCFAEPPTAEEAVAALETTPPQGPRRVLTLSDDIDAFLPAKAGLSRAGHSVSMACDAKQALDLLSMLRPDAVLVDLRTAPHAAAELLAALSLEQGSVLVLLVHGDPAGDALPQVMRRLLRPAALEPADLVQVCRAAVSGAVPAARGAPLEPIAFERPKPPARPPAPRRLVTRRR